MYVISEIIPELYPLDSPDHPYYSFLQPYSLSTVLDEFRSPEQIYIKSFNVNPLGNLTHIQLYYPNIGVMFEYLSQTHYALSPESNFIARICPTYSLINLRLFDPAGDVIIDSLLDFHDKASLYKEIGQVTNMSVEQFVEQYKQANCDAYIETPAEIWQTINDIG